MATVSFTRLKQTGPNAYMVEASELGWAPGFWPHSITLDRSVGTGQGFYMLGRNSARTVYKQYGSAINISVLND